MNIGIVDQAIEELKQLGATIVEPPAEGLFTAYIRRHLPALQNASWTKQNPEMFPVDAAGKPTKTRWGHSSISPWTRARPPAR